MPPLILENGWRGYRKAPWYPWFTQTIKTRLSGPVCAEFTANRDKNLLVRARKTGGTPLVKVDLEGSSSASRDEKFRRPRSQTLEGRSRHDEKADLWRTRFHGDPPGPPPGQGPAMSAVRGEAHPPAESFIPSRPTLAALARAAQGCTACDLYKRATQAVLGAGPRAAPALLVGEQPGDQEDLAGKPFVGPAGRVLDEALEEAGIARSDVFVTHAVKHFKGEPRGKRRLHQKPTLGEVRACRPWLEAELAIVKPRIVVCLGATAAQSLLGPAF